MKNPGTQEHYFFPKKLIQDIHYSQMALKP